MKWKPQFWDGDVAKKVLVTLFLPITYLLVICLIIAVIIAVIITAGGSLYLIVMGILSGPDHEALRNYLLGLAALLGAPFLIWRTMIAAQQIQINRESHYTDLFTKAVEQLGADKIEKRREFTPLYKRKEEKDGRKVLARDEDGEPIPATRGDGSPLGEWASIELTVPNIEVRHGAMFALDRVAQDSERDLGPILDTLAAYARNNTSGEFSHNSKQNQELTIEELEQIPHPRLDIMAAMKVISSHLGSSIDFELFGEREKLDCQNVTLRNATLHNLCLSSVNFTGARMEGMDLLSTDLSRSVFTRADLSHSQIHRTIAINAHFDNCEIRNSNIFDSKFSDSSFSKSNIVKTQFQALIMRRVEFHNAQFTNSVIAESDLTDSSFYRANCSQSAFYGVNFKNAHFYRANLYNANFDDCDLAGVSFAGANVIDAKFTESRNVDLTDAFTEKVLEELPRDDHPTLALNLSDHINDKWLQWLKPKSRKRNSSVTDHYW